MDTKEKLNKFIFTKTRIIIFITLVLFTIIIGEIFKQKLENLINYRSLNINKTIDYNSLTVHFIDVGQGDAIVVTLPDNKILLIDTGNTDNESKLKYKNFLEDEIFKNREYIVDYFILTHSDNDHCGSAEYIFENYEVKNFYRPKQFVKGNFDNFEDKVTINLVSDDNFVDYSSNKAYALGIKASYNEENLKVIYNEKGIRLENFLYEYKFEFLTPSLNSYSNENDFSPIILLTYKDKKILFTGDAEAVNEYEILNNVKAQNIDILKCGHHGSKSSSTTEFLKITMPKYAIISCGKNNGYGHPSSATISRLKVNCDLENENIFRTDLMGTITVNINKYGYLNIFTKLERLKVYIHIEYVLMILIVIYFCFSFYDFKYHTKLEKLKEEKNEEN